jgi:predicted enzyme related to lactoylglutathione lyase
MLGQVTHVTIHVNDQEKARDFYRDTFGFDIVADMSMEMGGKQMKWLTVRPKGGNGPEIALWPGGGPSGGTVGGFTGLVLHVSEIDATYEELKAKGVSFPTPPEDVPWGRHALMADLDGNIINIVQPAEGKYE